MKGRTLILGLCMLCALAASAVAAQSALAITGATAFTCKEVAAGTGKFKKAHCTTADAGTGNFEHVAVPEGVTTEAKGETTVTPGGANLETRLHSVISGVSVELISKVVHGTGSIENLKDPSGEHYIHLEGTVQYTEVEVGKPEGKGCKVENEKLVTNTLTGTTTGQGTGLKTTPKEGAVFMEFNVAGCAGSKALEALNGKYEVTGSVIGTSNGATTTLTAAATTAQGTLKLRGQNAGIDGSVTLSGKLPAEGTYTPLSATIVTT